LTSRPSAPAVSSLKARDPFRLVGVADRDREPEREDEPDVDEPPDKRDLASCVKGVEGVAGGFEDGGREGVT